MAKINKIVNLELDHAGWVSADGSYGVGSITLFAPSKISKFQWLVLDNLADSDKQEYIKAVIDRQDLSQWEDDYEDERETNG
jgi:hypothetical protein